MELILAFLLIEIGSSFLQACKRMQNPAYFQAWAESLVATDHMLTGERVSVDDAKSAANWRGAVMDFLTAMAYTAPLLYTDAHTELRQYAPLLLVATVVSIIALFEISLRVIDAYLRWMQAFMDRMQRTHPEVFHAVRMTHDGTLQTGMEKSFKLSAAAAGMMSIGSLTRLFVTHYTRAVFVAVIYLQTNGHAEYGWLPVVGIAVYCGL